MAKENKPIPPARHEQIITWLEQEGTLSIKEIQSRLNISHMTVHRDLDYLAGKNLLKKVRGGATRITTSTLNPNPSPNCKMCGRKIVQRTEIVLQMDDGNQSSACCPHCGLMLIANRSNIESALARDYLYGYMVNVFQASYLIGCELRICCIPSTLCFAHISDAQRFQTGFGGKIFNFTEALNHLMDIHQP